MARRRFPLSLLSGASGQYFTGGVASLARRLFPTGSMRCPVSQPVGCRSFLTTLTMTMVEVPRRERCRLWMPGLESGPARSSGTKQRNGPFEARAGGGRERRLSPRVLRVRVGAEL
jgi:hypothetical protein